MSIMLYIIFIYCFLLYVIISSFIFNEVIVGQHPSSLKVHYTRKSKIAPVKVKRPSHPPMEPLSKTSKEKFMSYFPHGDLASQHEAVRNAFRIALETKRTLILPQLRLGAHSSWEPFPVLQKKYEEEDKQKLEEECKVADSNLCSTLNDWIEVPWSTFFDLRAIEKKFHIRIKEREQGHGWGVHDPSAQNMKSSDVVVIDPTSFPSNGSDWDPISAKVNTKSSFFTKWFRKTLTEEEKSISLKSSLTKIVRANQLARRKERYIQFGSLLYGLRFQTSPSKAQNDLHKALMTDTFVSPNRLQLTNEISRKIITALGGPDAYSVLHFKFEKLARSELENIRSLALSEAAIRSAKVHVPDVPGKELSSRELIELLSPIQQSELMRTLVRELYGDMPINQALAAGLEFEPSTLKTLLSSKENLTSFEGRRRLLSACTDYKTTINKKYPVHFLFNDAYEDIVHHKDLFGPLLETFPCTFTIGDFYGFEILEDHWGDGFKLAKERGVDYKRMLLPIVEVLVARSSYSFFEAPVSKLTRLIAWH
ncbi:hypothetical protein K501DRAFT_274477 [Backusella circina FSU 941]|nr:hypothetical protein K501DRAFT_274477 [Backusella circina FSU 941]